MIEPKMRYEYIKLISAIEATCYIIEFLSETS
jgi:hypothetical protein